MKIKNSLTHADGMIEGKNWVGRPRQSYEVQIMNDIGCRSYSKLKKIAQDREKWRTSN